MKLKESVEFKTLLGYQFSELNEEYKRLNNVDDDETLYYHTGWIYNLGYSRRGQSYYLIIHEDREISILATKPDGSGGTVALDNVLFNLISDGIIEKS